MWIEVDVLRGLLMGRDGTPGVFERTVGFQTATNAIKGVHIVNDLAQTVLGGAPDHGGDLLCRIVREQKTDAGEDNSDETLRRDPVFGAPYARAFPATLGAERVTRARAACSAVLTFDGGMYRAGDRMASSLATHRALLGFEGFRRFGVGRYLANLLGEAGRSRVADLFDSPTDPLSRALSPLLLEAPLKDTHPRGRDATPELSELDRDLGRRLTTLLSQPVTKPLLLRLLLLTASLGVCLKVLGLGMPGGRPIVLATAADDGAAPRLLRQEAVQTFNHGVAKLDERLAAALDQDGLLAKHLTARRPLAPALAVDDARAALAAARDSKPGEAIYWPDAFAIALGRKAGCILPKQDKAGWGKHLVLTPDLIEALVLAYVGPGAPPRPWTELWGQVRDELGLIIGADDHGDVVRLRAAGVLHLSVEDLAANSDRLLNQAVTRGVGRRLPDSGAEAGGELQ